MTINKKKLQMPAWLGILLMPFMLIFSGIGLVIYVTTMSFSVLAIQAAGIVMAGHAFLRGTQSRVSQRVAD